MTCVRLGILQSEALGADGFYQVGEAVVMADL
jgi:hypothetical protein